MPPPNVTGQLHMGHALDETMQDILIRFKRMQGYEALWQPGTDHAAIATEVKVTEKLVKKKGIDKNEIGREKIPETCLGMERRVRRKDHQPAEEAWVHPLTGRENVLPWMRDAPRLYRKYSSVLYEKGYIYKGSRIINWCPVCQTSISDAEVEHEDQDGFSGTSITRS